MASNANGFSSTISLLLFVFVLVCGITPANSQNTGNSPTFPECQRTLIALLPCQPFVQGMTSFPSLSCCSNLQQYLGEDQELRCFCFLLNVPTLPFNRALALQLPSFCRLNNATPSTCSGLPQPQPQPEPEPEPEPFPVTPMSPPPQENLQSSPNSTEADSPVVTVIPKSNIMGFGFKNSGEKLDGAEIHVAILALLLAVLSLLIAI